MSDAATSSLEGDELIEPLQVADVQFHVTKSIDQCPPGLQARELLMNAIEAEALPEENGSRRIRIYSVEIEGVPKLAIWNTGRGMTAEELIRATDLASSIRKKQGLEGRENRGEGAKVASLPWNHSGLSFRSCHGRRVSEVVLARVNDVYGRKREAVFDESDDLVYQSVWDITDTTATEKHQLDFDWTEVVCMGRSPDQDTTRFPYGEAHGEGRRREVLSEVFDGFYSMAPGVILEADEALHGRKGAQTFRMMSDIISRWGDDHSKLRAERVSLGDGIQIEFVYTPMLPGGNTVMGARELTGQSTRIALVWNGEMYDTHIGPQWRGIAAGFGLPHVHSVISVFVHLPETALVRNGPYRLDLRRKETGEKLEVEDFQAEIRSRMPQWVRDLVADALKPRQASDMSAVRKELERRLREARIRPVNLDRPGTERPKAPIAGSGPHTLEILERTKIPGPTPGPGPRPHNQTVTDPDAPIESNPSVPQQNAIVKRRQALKAISTAPELVWLDTPEQVEAEELIDRAGKYEYATNTLYLNGLYDAVEKKISNLQEHYGQQVDWDQVRPIVVDKVRAAMALHIGSVVVYALAKQGLPKWNDNQWKAALTTESLTVASDQSEYILGDIRTGLAQTAAFKMAKVV
jgi:hypothetical protein